VPPLTATVGVARFTVSVTPPEAPVKSAVSVGVKLTRSVWFCPAESTSPAAAVVPSARV